MNEVNDLVSTVEGVDTSEISGLEYPCVEAVDCDNYIAMFVQKRICRSDSQVPVFSRGPRGIIHIGKMDLDFDTLLSLSRFPAIKLVYHQSPTESFELDVHDPNMLEKFIEL